MVDCCSKDWLDWASLITPIVGLFIATYALYTSRRLAKEQNSLQKRQLKQALFEKRYALFRATDEYFFLLFRERNGVSAADLRWTKYADAKSETSWLFPATSNVPEYVAKLYEAGRKYWAKATEWERLNDLHASPQEMSVALSEEREALDRFLAIHSEREDVFGPFLRLED